MRRTPALALVGALIAAGCTGSPLPAASSPHAVSPRPTLARVATSDTTLDRIVLTASGREKARRWVRVASIGFGAKETELGVHILPEFAPSEPYALAVAPDETFWIADRWKRRIAHYSTSGRFLASVPVPLDHGRYQLQDVIAIGGDVIALSVALYGYLLRLSPDGSVTSIHVTFGGQAIALETMFSTPVGLVARTSGFTEAMVNAQPHQGPLGYVRIDTSTGVATSIPGLPLPDGSTISVDQPDPTSKFDVRYAEPYMTLVQPMTVRYTRDGRRTTPCVGGPEELTIDGDDVVSFVSISADIPRSDRDGGRWLLRLGKGSLVWERLPAPLDGFDDSAQARHIAVGPDGAIYLMLETKKGVQILQRPSS